jgi:hypothetical protein
MVNLNVYEEKDFAPVVNLRLIKQFDVITLCCVSAHGMVLDGGTLLAINTDGTISRGVAVSDKLGFKLDNGFDKMGFQLGIGRVVIEN